MTGRPPTRNVIDISYWPGPVAERAHRDRSRVKLAWGPIGTAKTTWLCWRIYYLAERAAKQGHSLRALLLRDTYRNLADSTLKTWFHWFPDDVMGRKTASLPVDFALRTPDGREHEVLFRHGQNAADASAFLSTEYGFIGLEEVAPAYMPGPKAVVSPGIAKEVFDMALGRLRQPGIDEPELAMTANPPPLSHWLSKHLIDLTPEQLQKRNWQQFFFPISDNQKNLRPTYYDELEASWEGNQALIRRFLRGERLDIFLGIPRFNLDSLQAMRDAAQDAPARGLLREEGIMVRLDENPEGWVRMWHPPLPGAKYVIGSDVAEGLEGGDYSCGHVWERDPLRMVAEWHGHIEPEAFGSELAKLGRAYNRALIGVEANNHGLTTLTALRRLGYDQLYYRKTIDERSRSKTQRMGWLTTTSTKPLMIDGLAAYLAEGGQFPSYETIGELMTYGVMADGTTNAQAGCFDDRVIASAIAIQVNKVAGLDSFYPGLSV